MTTQPWRLLCGNWREVLDPDQEWDALVTDPPYSATTHAYGGVDGKRRQLSYDCWTPAAAAEALEELLPRTRGWALVFTDHELAPRVLDVMKAAGRRAFAPLPVIRRGGPNMVGDGPVSSAVYLCVSRPRGTPWNRWGHLPGWYQYGLGVRGAPIVGCKPAHLLAQIVGDYTRPGDLVCDPYAGSGSTLLGATVMGRRALGAEVDPETYAWTKRRLEAEVMKLRPVDERDPRQQVLFST